MQKTVQLNDEKNAVEIYPIWNGEFWVITLEETQQLYNALGEILSHLTQRAVDASPTRAVEGESNNGSRN